MSRTAASRSAAPSAVLTISGSSSASPTVWRGFSEPYGFWNTICTSRRSVFNCAALALATSMPPRCREPAVGVSIIVSSRASVDLPQPDSPTTASVRPACSANDTPLSALTVAERANRPRATWYSRARPSACITTGASADRARSDRAASSRISPACVMPWPPRRGASGCPRAAGSGTAPGRGRPRRGPAAPCGSARRRTRSAARTGSRRGG